MLSSFKKIIKKNPVVYFLNSTYKASRALSEQKKLFRYYKEKSLRNNVIYSEGQAIKNVVFKIRKKSKFLPKNKGDLNIFWLGTHYDQDYSGFIQGLRKFGKVTEFICDYNGYDRNKWISVPLIGKRLCAPVLNENILSQVMIANKKNKLDLFIGQLSGEAVDYRILKKIQDVGITTINIAMDDKISDLWGWEKDVRLGSVGLKDGLDFVLTTFPESCLWYAVEGCDAFYWPLASSPEVFSPKKEKDIDVVFVGSNYGARGKLIKKIKQAGINVQAYGPGFPNGAIKVLEQANLFSRSKIILGTGYVSYNKNILTLKLRDFDGPMSGALYLTNRNPDLLKLFKEGEEIECFDTIDECIKKIKYYLANDDERIKIAGAGLRKAKTEHTWENRIEGIFKKLEIIN